MHESFREGFEKVAGLRLPGKGPTLFSHDTAQLKKMQAAMNKSTEPKGLVAAQSAPKPPTPAAPAAPKQSLGATAWINAAKTNQFPKFNVNAGK
jgi:hypothetical protein